MRKIAQVSLTRLICVLILNPQLPLTTCPNHLLVTVGTLRCKLHSTRRIMVLVRLLLMLPVSPKFTIA